MRKVLAIMLVGGFCFAMSLEVKGSKQAKTEPNPNCYPGHPNYPKCLPD